MARRKEWRPSEYWTLAKQSSKSKQEARIQPIIELQAGIKQTKYYGYNEDAWSLDVILTACSANLMEVRSDQTEAFILKTTMRQKKTRVQVTPTIIEQYIKGDARRTKPQIATSIDPRGPGGSRFQLSNDANYKPQLYHIPTDWSQWQNQVTPISWF